jgi:hypothetical protein
VNGDIRKTEIPFPRRIETPAEYLQEGRFQRLEFFPGTHRLWWDRLTGRLYVEELCNGPSTWSYYTLPDATYYRDKLKHLAALCGMASSKLCLPVSEKDIASAKECVEVGIEVMRQLLEEDKPAVHTNGSGS